MKYISVEEAYTEDFGLFSVLAFPQRWNDLAVYKMPESGRPDSGFMLVTDCSITMISGERTVKAEVGQIVYLPMGAKYESRFSAKCNSDGNRGNITNYLLNFIPKNADGEVLNFSDEIRVITPKDSARLGTMFREICEKSENAAYPTSLLKSLAYSVIAEISRQTREAEYGFGKSKNVFAAADYIGRLCFRGDIKISEIAESCHVSEATLRRMFIAEFGIPPKDYINNLRISRARQLLESGDVSVAEVAYLCGFEDASYFSRFFKKQTGKKPMEIQEKQ